MGATPVIGGMNIVLSGDAKTFSEALDQAQRRIDQLAGKNRSFGRSASSDFAQAGQAAQKFGHSSITSVQAASGALRELNGNFTNNIRAVERFITMIPGVGNALKFAFPLVGGLAFAAVLVDMVGKVREFIKQTDELPAHIRDGFAEMHQAARLANDALAVTNDHLAAEIAKLEHKPVNALQTALDDDRLAADQLSDSLGKAIAKSKELIEKNKVGFWGKALGQAGTEDVTAFVSSTQAKLSAITEDFQPAIDAATSPENMKALSESRLAAYQDVYTKAHAEARQRLGVARNSQYLYDTHQFGTGADQRANIAILGGFDTQMSDEEKSLGAQYLQGSQKGTLAADQAGKEGADHSGQELRKAAVEQMKGFQSQLATLKNDHDVSSVEEYQFWEGLAKAAAKYPDNLRKVQEETGRLYQQMGKEIQEFARKYDEEGRKRLALRKQGDEEAQRLDDEMSRAEHRGADSIAAYNAANKESADAMREMMLAHEVATGSVSRHDAAVQLAALHARSYAAQLARLNDETANDLNDSTLTPDQRAANEEGRRVRRSNIEGARDRTAYGDQQAIDGSTVMGAARDAITEFTTAALDSAAQMKNLVSGTLADLNRTLLAELTSRRGGARGVWGALGKNLATRVAGSALEQGEGSLIKGATSHGLGWLKSLGSLASGFSIPGFAEGGDFMGNTLAMVGERGPELVRFGRAGSVVPNHELGGAMGGQHFHSWSIDARGSNDPAAVRAAIMEAAPHIAAAGAAQAVRHMHDQGRRTPGVRPR